MALTFVFKIAKFSGFENENFYRFFAQVLDIHELSAVVLTHAVLLFLFYRIWKYEKEQSLFDIKQLNKKVNWLKFTLILLYMSTLLWTYLAIRNIFQPQYFTSFYGLWIVQSVFIYWLGHIGIYKYGVLKTRKKIREFALNSSPRLTR